MYIIVTRNQLRLPSVNSSIWGSCDFGPPPLFQSTSLSAVKVGFYEIYARRTRSVLMICLHYFLRAPLLWIFSCSIFLYYLPTSLKGLLLWVLLVCSFRADKLRNIRLNSIKNLCSVFDWIKRSSQLWISHGEFPIVKEHPKGRIEAEAVIFRNRTPKPKRELDTRESPGQSQEWSSAVETVFQEQI